MKKQSGKRGKSTSEAEVTSISGDGIRLQLDGLEYFLGFENFPWFRDGAVRAVLNVRRVSENHLSWPDLDVDLAVESIVAPERFPLVSRASGNNKPKTGRGGRL